MEPSVESAKPDILFSIELTNGMQSIKELYFIEGRGSIFSHKHTKAVLLATFIFILLSGLFYLLSYSDKIVWIFLFCMAVMARGRLLIYFFYKGKRIFPMEKRGQRILKGIVQI